MLTPCFSLDQDEKNVIIVVCAPFCDLYVHESRCVGHDVFFYCSPYYLRLALPGKLVESDPEISYDADTSEFTLVCQKENFGEHFPDLEFITTLLRVKTDVVDDDRERKIEVLGNESENVDFSEEQGAKYGFALLGGYKFKNLVEEFKNIFKVNPFEVQFEERKQLRLLQEDKDFDLDHYAADFLDNEHIKELMLFLTPWDELKVEDIQFSKEESNFLRDLPDIQHNLTEEQTRYCLHSLVDILFAYCYDARTTYFDPTCESYWTISNICASFSWFDSFANPKEAIISGYRRSLIYPLVRSFELCESILKDLKKLLSLGEKYIVKCLIQMYDIFLDDERGGYVINKMFIRDYIIYVLKWDQKAWKEVIDIVKDIVITKDDLGMKLYVVEDRINENALNVSLEKLRVSSDGDSDSSPGDSNSDSESSDDEDSESSDEDSESSDEDSESSDQDSDRSTGDSNSDSKKCLSSDSDSKKSLSSDSDSSSCKSSASSDSE